MFLYLHLPSLRFHNLASEIQCWSDHAPTCILYGISLTALLPPLLFPPNFLSILPSLPLSPSLSLTSPPLLPSSLYLIIHVPNRVPPPPFPITGRTKTVDKCPIPCRPIDKPVLMMLTPCVRICWCLSSDLFFKARYSSLPGESVQTVTISVFPQPYISTWIVDL